MDSRQLLAFQAVAHAGSMTRAAVELGYSQSAVTAQIKALEAAMRSPLFDRSPNGVTLTRSGELFKPYAARILRLSEEARTAVTAAHAPHGTVFLGASESITTYRLPELVECFHHRYPRIRLSLQTFHEGSAAVLRSLDAGEIDVALMQAGQPGPTENALRLAEDDTVLVAAADHPLAKLDQLEPQMLTDASLLIARPDCAYASALRDGFGYTDNTLQFGTLEGVKKAVVDGLGISLMPRIAVQDLLTAGAITTLPWRAQRPLSIYAVWGNEAADGPLIRSLIDTLQQVAAGWGSFPRDGEIVSSSMRVS